MSEPVRILFIPLEFSTWQKARHLSYGSQLALEEGLEAAGVDYLTVPAVCDASCVEANPRVVSPWLMRLKELCAGRSFDQVWIELAHSNYDELFLEWITDLAPVRVGFLGESLNYSEAVMRQCPILRTRAALIMQRLRYVTHAMFADEKDADKVLMSTPDLKADFYFSPVPGRILSEDPGPVRSLRGLFMGAVYGERAAWLTHPALKGLLEGRVSPETSTEYPALFDTLNTQCHQQITAQKHLPSMDIHDVLREYMNGLRLVRKACYAMWNSALREAALVVNLPQYGSMYAGRVIEAMAVGRPVATKPLQDRPRTMSAFESGKEILHYSTPEELAQITAKVVSDPSLANQMAKDARAKVSQFCTAEAVVKRILEWTGAATTGMATKTPLSSLPLTMKNKEEPPVLKAPPPPTDHDTAFYTHHFTQHPEWSKAEPNQDESARLLKIQSFVEQCLGPAATQPTPRRWRILDLGCGRGWLTNRMTAWGDCTGVEPIAPVVENAKRLFPGIQFYSGTSDTILSLPDFRPFDLIVSTEVIEHVPRDTQAHFVDNIRKLLKRRGYVILTTPRAEAWDAWYQLARPDQPVEDWLSETDMQNLFSGCGFEALGIQRIYVGAPGISYFNCPAPDEMTSDKIFPIYQVWLFQAP